MQIKRPLVWRCFFHLALSFSSIGANLTEKIRKIKIVFTPTICKQTCRSGRCYNSCEKGDTTTLYSQGGHDHDPKSGFRICEHPKAPSPPLCLLPLSPPSAFPASTDGGLGLVGGGRRWPLPVQKDVSWSPWGLLHLCLWGKKTDLASLLSFLGKQILFPSRPR